MTDIDRIDRDRARGLMAGIAVGNLLGIPMEGDSKARIARRYPDGVREIAADSGCPDDDDLALAIEVAEAAEAAEGLDVDALGLRFWRWAETNGSGMGMLTAEVLTLYGGTDPQRLACMRAGAGETVVRKPRGVSIIEASRQAWNGGRAGNGALMRCAPLAIRWRDDPHRLVRESVVSAVSTHWDRRCGWSCAIANLATAAALRGEMLSADDLLRSARDGVAAARSVLSPYGYRSEAPSSVTEAVRGAARSTLDELEFDGRGMGGTLLSLQGALLAYWQAEGFEAGVCRMVAAGGDTDTNGAIVGAVLGARFGLSAIPEHWRRRVDEVRAGRVSMESLADRLAASAGGRGPPRPRTSGFGTAPGSERT